MGRRPFNRVCAINYPSRVEGWMDVCETEGELTRKHKALPWSPLYCVLQQDEQSFTAYCSEEISIFPATPKKELSDVLFNDYPRVRLDRARRPAKVLWDGPPTLQEEPEEDNISAPSCVMDIAINTTLYSDLVVTHYGHSVQCNISNGNTDNADSNQSETITPTTQQ